VPGKPKILTIVLKAGYSLSRIWIYANLAGENSSFQITCSPKGMAKPDIRYSLLNHISKNTIFSP
jgi:hypothetical protein